MANNTSWKLFRPAKIGEYIALVRRSYRFQPDHDELLPVDSERWRDQGNSLDPHGPRPTQVKAVLAASPECRGVRLPIVNGRVRHVENDPCDVDGKDRIELSNGTVCLDWPIAVIDGPGGREIVADQKALHAALERIAEEHRTVVFAGQSAPERCSPTIVWTMQR